MISKLTGILFVAALAAVCLALALGYGPATYYDAQGEPPASQEDANTQTIAAHQTRGAMPDDASIAKDKQPGALIQAQD